MKEQLGDDEEKQPLPLMMLMDTYHDFTDQRAKKYETHSEIREKIDSLRSEIKLIQEEDNHLRIDLIQNSLSAMYDSEDIGGMITCLGQMNSGLLSDN